MMGLHVHIKENIRERRHHTTWIYDFRKNLNLEPPWARPLREGGGEAASEAHTIPDA
jgi:hypothetical protein